MGIKAVLDSLDDLNDEMKALYKEGEDGKFVLDVEGFDAHPEVRGVITANKANKEKRDALKAENDTLKQRLEGLPEDFDADAFNELKQAAEGKGGQVTDEQKAEIRDKIKAQLEAKHAKDLEARDQRIQKLEGSINRMTVDEGLSRAMDDADIDPKHKPVLLPFLKTKGKITVEEDGEAHKAVVETDMGPLELHKWVSEFAASDEGKRYVAKSTGPDAKGGQRNGADPKTIPRTQFDALDLPARQQKIADGVQVVD